MPIHRILDPEILTTYSLVLIKDQKIIYRSRASGIKPLIYCVQRHFSDLQDCTLYDKVVGLAAAKIIVYSQMISHVLTPVASKKAQALLRKSRINLEAQKIVPHILKRDRESICPLEIQALNVDDHALFFQKMKLHWLTPVASSDALPKAKSETLPKPTLLRSFGATEGYPLRLHPRAYARSFRRRRVKKSLKKQKLS